MSHINPSYDPSEDPVYPEDEYSPVGNVDDEAERAQALYLAVTTINKATTDELKVLVNELDPGKRLYLYAVLTQVY
jgi:hypothetical protein